MYKKFIHLIQSGSPTNFQNPETKTANINKWNRTRYSQKISVQCNELVNQQHAVINQLVRRSSVTHKKKLPSKECVSFVLLIYKNPILCAQTANKISWNRNIFFKKISVQCNELVNQHAVMNQLVRRSSVTHKKKLPSKECVSFVLLKYQKPI